MDNTDKVIDFLREISNQLGQTGTEAFRIVAQRVFAESIIGVILGIVAVFIFLVLGLKTIFWAKKNAEKDPEDEAPFYVAVFGGVMIFLSMGTLVMHVISNLINLLSLEYTTINRIIDLVGKAT